MSEIWTPSSQGADKELWIPGFGSAPAGMSAAAQAVNEYDPDLAIGRDERTGDFVVLLKRGPDGTAFPVLGLGRELPDPNEIKRRLHKADTRRRGRQIVADIERNNARQRKVLKDAAHEAAGDVAETIDTAFHLMKRHPVPRIFVPSGKGK